MDSDELLVLGLKLLGKLHAGILDLNCTDCDESRKIALNCSGLIIDNPVYLDEDLGDFYYCPIKLITEEIYKLYDEYSYYQTFVGTAPNYSDKNERFWQAIKIYKNSYDKYAEQKRNKSESKVKEQDTSKSLASLKNGFKGKKK